MHKYLKGLKGDNDERLNYSNFSPYMKNTKVGI